MSAPKEIDDDNPYAAQGILDAAVIQALFHGRRSDDPAAVEFVATLEREAARLIDCSPNNATMLNVAAKLARLTIGMPIKNEH